MNAGPSPLPPDDRPGDSTQDEEAYIRSLEAQLWVKAVSEPGKQPPEWPFPDWDRYQFLAFLGQGAMGMVFSVFDPVLNRPVAIKLLSDEAMAHSVRFLDEARAQARVDHPNVAKVHEVGAVEGRPFLIMQLLQGEPLHLVAERLCLEERVEILRQACEGVQAAHSKGLLHGDLKPGNIVVEKDQDSGLHAFVVDFGMARETAGGGLAVEEVMGTPAFMSPEQAAGEMTDRRSDVFSLGTTLYAVLTGHLPFGGESLLSTMGKVAQTQADSPRKFNAAIPLDLEAIVGKAMEKDPTRRYPSAKALGMDLKRWLEGEAVEAMPQQRLYRMECWVKKNRALALASVLLATTLIGAMAWGIRIRRRGEMQAKYYQHYGQEAERMEGALALAEAMPLHDTLPVRQILQKKMHRLEQSMASLGDVAEAPGLYALGRGHLTLGNWQEGRKALERAWGLGLETPEVAFSLGNCLSQIYQDELSGLAGPMRMDRKAELDCTLKPLILAYLSKARGGAEESMGIFAEALLARAEGRDEEALARADQVLQNESWQVRAVLLKAGIYIDQAYDKPPGAALLAKARALLDQAREMARSSVAVYELDALVWYREMYNAIHARKVFTPYMDRVLDALAKARQAHSQSMASFVWEAKAWLLSREEMNAWFWKKEEDIDKLPEVMHRVITCAEKAGALGADASLVSNTIGNAWWRLAYWEMQQGLDPRRSLDASIATFTRVLERNRFLDYLLMNLGTAFFIKGNWEMGTGMDPLASYMQGLDYYRQVASIKPSHELYFNMALLHASVARFHQRQGRGAGENWESALKAALKSREGSAGSADDSLVAGIYLSMFEASLWQGKPDPALCRLGYCYAEKALATAPGDPEALGYTAWGNTLGAFVATGKADLDAARASLQQALRVRPESADLLYYDAWLGLAHFRRHPSWGAYLRLEKRVESALKAPQAKPECYYLAYEACRLAAEQRLPGATPEAWRARGKENLEKARRLNPMMGPEVDRLGRAL